MPDALPATIERGRCLRCGEEVSPDHRAPCPECGALLHGRCYVEAGGCPTIGCSNAAAGLVRRPKSAVAIREARRARAARVHTTVVSAGIASGTAGVAGMTLSLLAMNTVIEGMIVGAFGFLAGALLVTTGVIVLAIAALRPPRGPDGRRPHGPLAVVAQVLATVALAAGVGGMTLSFLVLAVGSMIELIAGGAGFAAGAFLVLGGGVSSALLALRDPRDDEADEP